MSDGSILVVGCTSAGVGWVYSSVGFSIVSLTQLDEQFSPPPYPETFQAIYSNLLAKFVSKIFT